MTNTSGYVLDQAWHAERDRLESLTSLYDERTLELCERLGLGAGWDCLDAGAGTGSLALRLLERVAPNGTVAALDADTRFLRAIEANNFVVLDADLTTAALPVDRYDLVHSRLVLEHLPRRDEALAKLVAAVRPGGWLLIEDFDWSTAMVIDPPDLTYDRVARACLQLFTANGYDPYYGRTLPRRLQEAGLSDVGTHAASVQVQADVEAGLPQWELLVQQLTPALREHGLVDERDLVRFRELCHDGTTVCFAPLMVSTWGRSPRARSRTRH
jgi:ubiquinone/menaquinone biosynthesis C-methylase UbiE